ncbi:NlpC/P60 family protein [Streptomyces sp. NBC_00663]|uniref:C40 family peptidase n=1 Tax=Streptomyces sp. NBC_00663 TaxID=2975801 RepID=UPI002E346C6D|nr:NlpC/P60 family protein [Streptomyces sp. NBC_00663]
MSPEPLRSQSSGVPSAGEGEAPSRDEVRRRINSLYDRAESDTGTFNATRALAIPRQRGGGGRGSQDSVEPALSDLTRQWFDAARAKLGPTVAAPRTAGRGPSTRPAPAARAPRPARPAERPAEPLALEAPRAPKATVPELPAAPVRELTAGPAPAAEPRPDAGTWGTGPQPVLDGGATWGTGSQPVLDGGATRWPLPEPAMAHVPEPTAVLPTVQDSVLGSYEVSPPANDGALFGTGPATAGIAPYLRGGAADPAPSYTAEWPIDATPATYEAALPMPPELTPFELMPSELTPSVPTAYESAAVAATAAMPAAFASAPSVPTFTAPPAYPTSEVATPAPAVSFAPTPLEPPVTPAAFDRPAPPPADVARSTKAERVIDFARAQIGRPCVWGAAGPGSFDAPGLSQAAWKVAGVTLPRTVQAQAGAGMPVTLADVQPGDLVFFHDDLSHVGIWTGNGMMIHAPGPGTPVREESVFFAGQTAIRGAVRPA